MSPVAPRRVVVAAFSADPGEHLDRLRELVGAVIALGWEPDVLLLGDGEDIGPLRRLVPVTVVDEFRRRGLGFAPHVLGLRRPQQALKRYRLQRWLAAREGLPWIILDPRAAAPLRYGSPGGGGAIIGCLLGAGDRVDAIAERDRAVLDGAAAWLTTSDAAAAELASADLGPVTVLHRLVPPDDTVVDEGTWPLLLVPNPRPWTEINHTFEIASALVERHPSIPVHWFVHTPEDEWLARFDLDLLGLTDLVTIVWPDDTPVERYRMLVRTGYGEGATGARDKVEEAHRAGVPVVAFEQGDADDDRASVLPFDIAGLLAEVDRSLPDEQTIQVRAERLAAVTRDHAATMDALGGLLDQVAPVR